MASILLVGLTSALLLTILINKLDNFLENEGGEKWKI